MLRVSLPASTPATRNNAIDERTEHQGHHRRHQHRHRDSHLHHVFWFHSGRMRNVGPRSAARVQAVVAAPAMGQDWISDLRRTRIRELQLVKRF